MKRQKYTVSQGAACNSYYIWDEHGNYLEEDLSKEKVQDLINKNFLTKAEKRMLNSAFTRCYDAIINSKEYSVAQIERLERKLK